MIRPEPERLLTVKEAAAILGVKPGTLYLWAERGELPSYKIGALRRFRLADLEGYIESCRQAPEETPPSWTGRGGRASLRAGDKIWALSFRRAGIAGARGRDTR